MKAIVQDGYGSTDVLRYTDVEPPIPGDGEVLVRVRATSVHADVWHVMTGLPYVLRIMGSGLRRPKKLIPGTDLAGVVTAVGKDVTRFRVGDEVFGETTLGMQWVNGGSYAEYATAPESALALKPTNVSYIEAAAVPTAGLIALPNLRDAGRLKPGMNVLVNGAAGGVGTMTVQLAKALGARVTGVDRGDKLAMLAALGADEVIDYTVTDFTRGDVRHDVIVDIPGNHPLSACRRALKPAGVYVLIGHDHYGEGMHHVLGLIPRMMKLMLMATVIKQLPRPSFAQPAKQASMELLRELLAAGKLTPHIDRTFPLSEVPAALRYLQAGDVRGKVVVTID
jgi:NADPH:quinone reductase-like Zn-dependent oxidoreductase